MDQTSDGVHSENMRSLFPSGPLLESDRLLLRRLNPADAEDLARLTAQAEVYRYLPTFLFEKKYHDILTVIDKIYTEGLEDSLILGVFREMRFYGLAEVYGYRARIRKVSVGYRLLRDAWGQGIATEALGLMVKELTENRGIEIITASTMIENLASARVLMKNGFTLVEHAVGEDWGYPELTPADKWIK